MKYFNYRSKIKLDHPVLFFPNEEMLCCRRLEAGIFANKQGLQDADTPQLN